MREEAVMFGRSRTLVGVVTNEDTADSQLPAVLLLNAGLIHHVGPNRLYVRLSRRLARLGLVVLRFDLSGIGDSQARTDNLSIEARVIDDVRQAMDYLHQTRGISQFLLMGHCAGALASFITALQEPRAAGIVLINTEGGGDEWDDYDRKRKTSRYYQNYYGRGALADSRKWKRFLTGQVSYTSIARNIFQNILWNKLSTGAFKIKNRLFGARRTTTRPEIANMAAGLRQLAQRSARVLIVYSEGSTGLERTRLLVGSDLRDLSASGVVRVELVPQADHTFTLLDSQERLAQKIQAWCQTFIQAHPAAP